MRAWSQVTSQWVEVPESQEIKQNSEPWEAGTFEEGRAVEVGGNQGENVAV